MFTDRMDGGRALADALVERDVSVDVVLAIPRGGLPVGHPVAERLNVPLDIVVARKIGAPWNPELAVGAIASDGTMWQNDEMISQTGVDAAYIKQQADEEREAARAKMERYRTGRPPLDLAGKRVIVVDDGIATGATAIACIRQVSNAGASYVIMAAPVAAPETVELLSEEVDEVIAVETPAHFGAVGRFYRHFGQVSDDEARTFLRSSDEESSDPIDEDDDGPP